MNISTTPGYSPPANPGLSGSSGSPVGNPADTSTTGSQGPKIIDAQNIPVSHSSASKATGAVDHPSLPTPVADAVEAQIDATFAKLATMDEKTVLLDMGAILGLMAKFAQEMRTTGRMDRAAQLESKMNNLMSAAEQIVNAGQDRYKSAMISGALKIASGAMQLAMSAASFGMAVKSTTTTDTGAAIKFKAASESLTGAARGMDAIIDGISTMATADINLDAAKADAQRAIYEAFSQRDESKINEANEFFSQAMDILRKVMDTLQAKMQSDHESNSNIIGHI